MEVVAKRCFVGKGSRRVGFVSGLTVSGEDWGCD
jgi:hypothetical protein